MKLTREKLLAAALLLTVLAVNAVGLWPEISISRVDLNDNVYHFTLVERMVQAIEHGENPLDCWSSEWSLGYKSTSPKPPAQLAQRCIAAGTETGMLSRNP